MRNTGRLHVVLAAMICAAVVLQACGSKPAVTTTEHLRGTVQSLDGHVLTLATATGSVSVQLEQSTRVATLVQSSREHIAGGSFLGITSVAEPDGSERAVEIHVFPEDMRGTGEGSYKWDLPGADGGDSRMTNGTASRMTNGTVAGSTMTNGTVTAQVPGSVVTLQYKDGASSGSRAITIPPGIPVVAIEPGDAAADLQRGAHVFVVAHRSGRSLIADRVLAGKDGVVPPM